MSIKSKLSTLKFFLKKKRVIVMCRVFYGEEWMELALNSVEPYVYKIIILKSNKTWDESNLKSDDVEPIVKRLNKKSGKYVYIERDWGNQWQQQEQAWDLIANNYPEATHLLYLDTDEIYKPLDIKKLISYCASPKHFNKVLRVNMHTYIKDVHWRVSPMEIYKPIAIIPLLNYISFSAIRDVEGAPKRIVNVTMHHFSLVRKRNDIIKHKDGRETVDGHERVQNWYENVFLKINENSKNMHPLKGIESQWASIEVVADEDLPKGVVEVYNSWKQCKEN